MDNPDAQIDGADQQQNAQGGSLQGFQHTLSGWQMQASQAGRQFVHEAGSRLQKAVDRVQDLGSGLGNPLRRQWSPQEAQRPDVQLPSGGKRKSRRNLLVKSSEGSDTEDTFRCAGVRFMPSALWALPLNARYLCQAGPRGRMPLLAAKLACITHTGVEMAESRLQTFP